MSPAMAEDLSALAFDFAPIGIVLTEERIIRACNQTFAAMFGYQVEDLIDQSFRMLYSSHKEFEQIRDVGIESLKSTEKYSDERLMPRHDGTLFWCRVRVHTFDPENPLRRTILSYADISETRPVISLTVRERHIVQQLTRGLTSKEIGRNLSISPRTVEEHRARLLAKFEVKNVASLLARLMGYEV